MKRNSGLYFAFIIISLFHSVRLQAGQPEPAVASNKKVDTQTKLNHRLRRAFLKLDRAGVANAINAGADPNFTDERGNTLLHLACDSFFEIGAEHLQVVLFMMERGANHRIRNARGQTPLDVTFSVSWGVRRAPFEALRAMFRQREQHVALLEAMAEPGSFLRRLPPDLRQVVGEIAIPIMNPSPDLFHAIRQGNVGGVGLALRNGENADVADYNGIAAIMLAALGRDRERALRMVQYIMLHARDLNPSVRGQTLLEHLYGLPDRQEIVRQIEAGIHARGLPVPQRPSLSWVQRVFAFGSHPQAKLGP
jgi:hypothetical protein